MTIREFTTDEEMIRSGFEGSPHYEGKHLLLVPLVDDSIIRVDVNPYKGKRYILSDAAKDWLLLNSPTSYYAVRSGLTHTFTEKKLYGCFVFDNENEMLHFKMRWWPAGGI